MSTARLGDGGKHGGMAPTGIASLHALGRNLEYLKWAVFERLGIIRIYSKAPGKEPDLQAPFVMRAGSTVGEFAGEIHQDFHDKLKAARLWGSAAFDGQMVSRDHVLHDGDVLELRI